MEARKPPAQAANCLQELTKLIGAQQEVIERQQRRLEALERLVAQLGRENAALRAGPEQQQQPPAEPCLLRSVATLPAMKADSAEDQVEAVMISTGVCALPPRSPSRLHLFCCPAPPVPPRPAKPILAKLAECRDKNTLHQFCCPQSTSHSPSKSVDVEAQGPETVTCTDGSLSRDATAACSPARACDDASAPPGASAQSRQSTSRRASFQRSNSALRRAQQQADDGTTAATAAARRKHSLAGSYELSSDLQDKQVEMLERKYGGHYISRRAACTIQTAFREYQMKKQFRRIRDSMCENRVSKGTRMQLPTQESPIAGKAPPQGGLAPTTAVTAVIAASTDRKSEGKEGPKRTRHGGRQQGDTITELEDAFSKQVKSLAASIDDALNCRGLSKSDEEKLDSRSAGNDGGSSTLTLLPKDELAEDPSQVDDGIVKDKLAASYSDITLYIDEDAITPPSPTNRISAAPAVATAAAASFIAPDRFHSGCSISEGSQTHTYVRSTFPKTTVASQTVNMARDMRAMPIVEKAQVLMDSLSQDVPRKQHLSAHPLSPKSPSRGSVDSGSLPGASTARVLPPEAPSALRQAGVLSLGVNGRRQSKADSDFSDADNDSINSTSNSNETINYGSETSSHTSARDPALTRPGYHKDAQGGCDSPAFSNDIIRKRQYRIGLNLFNKKPEKGVAYLMERGFVPDTPVGVAHFLLQRKGLSRQMIGEFLGNRQRAFNRDVLDCVVDEMDFSGMELDEALRMFQAHIRVQGEAQKVERLIEAFSQRYCMCNPGVVKNFQNPDTIFILAFAIVLLNTDMYSPNVKPERKMKLDDFVKNLRGVDDGADIPREILVGIYERIQRGELKTNDDHVTQVANVEKTIVGKKPVLSLPHRRLVCYCRLFEVPDPNRPQKLGLHQREIFLFNDLLVVTKIFHKRKHSTSYSFRQSFPLYGMQVHLFENQYYQHGIRLVSSTPGSETEILVIFNAPNPEDRKKFVEDLKESTSEVQEMEKYRIEVELEKQKGIMRQTSAQGHAGKRKEATNGGMPRGSLDDSCIVGGEALKRSALSSSLRDLTDGGKRGRHGSISTLDGQAESPGMSSPTPPRKASTADADSLTASSHSRLSNSSSFRLGTIFGSLRGKSVTQSSRGRSASQQSEAAVAACVAAAAAAAVAAPLVAQPQQLFAASPAESAQAPPHSPRSARAERLPPPPPSHHQQQHHQQQQRQYAHKAAQQQQQQSPRKPTLYPE
uniref:IQ motif and SEC7 domain-containing protein 1-like isoform X1 n=1 Tax=Petromyzon marinus TaxID=7757 RepID=A0AAJ7X633_PETMA|nr:IQ motif and SEC7 domain-containing protein 1-like isoform X1 [Petromyzon marinus]